MRSLTTTFLALLVPLVNSAALPSTVELFAYDSTNTQLGCINGYGNFTRNQIWCYPFRVFPVTTGSSDANVQGYAKCTVAAGVLDCSSGGIPLGVFTETGADLAVKVMTTSSTSFSIKSFPAASDNVGVPLIVGSGGTYKQLKLQVKSVSG